MKMRNTIVYSVLIVLLFTISCQKGNNYQNNRFVLSADSVVEECCNTLIDSAINGWGGKSNSMV